MTTVIIKSNNIILATMLLAMMETIDVETDKGNQTFYASINQLGDQEGLQLRSRDGKIAWAYRNRVDDSIMIWYLNKFEYQHILDHNGRWVYDFLPGASRFRYEHNDYYGAALGMLNFLSFDCHKCLDKAVLNFTVTEKNKFS